MENLGGVDLIKKIRIVFVIITSILCIYGLISDNSHDVMPFMIFSLGVMFLFTGISELQENRKASAYFNFFVSVVNIFVSIDTLFF